MANYDAASIRDTIQLIRKTAGVDVDYNNSTGEWSFILRGKKLPVSDYQTVDSFNAILAETAARRVARQSPTSTPSPSPSPRPAPVPPSPPASQRPLQSGRYQGLTPAMAGLYRDWDSANSQNAQYDQDNAAAPPQNWWNRLTNTPQARAVLRPVRRYIGTLAAVGTLANIRESGNLGEQAASGLVTGAGSVVTGAVAAGLQIGNAILEGALSPFGKSGAAVSRLASQLTGTLQSALGSGIEGLAKLAGVGGKIIGTGVGLAGAGIGAGIGALAGAAVGNAPGFLIGAALGSLVGVALMKITEAISEGISTALGAIGKAFGAFGDLVTGVLKTVSDVLSDVTDAASSYAKQILSISHQSGASLGSSQRAIGALGALGIKPDDVPGLNQNRWVQQNYQRVYGVKGEFGTPEYINSFSNRYRNFADQGPLGLMLAQNMAKQLGATGLVDSAYLSQGQRNQAFSRSNTIQSAFGMNPEQIAQAGQKFNLLMASVYQFAEMVKVKIGGELFPFLNGILDKAISYVGSHADDISNFIKSGVHWLVADLPVLLVRGAQIGVTALEAMGHAFAGFGHVIANQLILFDKSQGALYGIVKNIAGVFDGIINTFHWFGAAMAATGALLHDAIAGVFVLLGPVIGPSAAKAVGFDLALQNPAAAAAKYFAANPDSNLAGMIPALQKTGIATRAGNALNSGADDLDAFTTKYGAQAQDALGKALGWAEENKRTQDASLNEQKKTNQHLEKVAKHTEATANGIPGIASALTARVLTSLAEDAVMTLVQA